MATDKTVIKSKKVKDLIERGKLDGNPDLPKYPSAQLWNKLMTETERQEFISYVEGADYSWPDYESEMKAHWPPEKKRGTPKWEYNWKTPMNYLWSAEE